MIKEEKEIEEECDYSEDDDFENSDGNDSDTNEILASTQAKKASELQRVVKAYNHILENTVSSSIEDETQAI